jgi:DNA-binding response OmpR family regulator
VPQILLIEDDDDVREGLEIALRHLVHEVRARGDGETGIAAVQESEPDVVVLDVMLPGPTASPRHLRDQQLNGSQS